MFCGERLGKLVLIQAMRSDSVRMLEGGMRVPSFALFYSHLRSVIPRDLLKGRTYPNQQPQPVHLPLRQLYTRRPNNILVIRNGDKRPAQTPSAPAITPVRTQGSKSTNQFPLGVGGLIDTKFAAHCNVNESLPTKHPNTSLSPLHPAIAAKSS